MKKEDAFVNDLLLAHPGDPANARYLVPLEHTEQEELAHAMADFIYDAKVDYFSDNITKEQADRVWEQCLIMPVGCCATKTKCVSSSSKHSSTRLKPWEGPFATRRSGRRKRRMSRLSDERLRDDSESVSGWERTFG